MQEALSQIFNETASTAHDAFPQKLNNLVVLLCPTQDMPVYVAPEILPHIQKHAADIQKTVQFLSGKLEAGHADGMASPLYPFHGEYIKIITLNDSNSSNVSPKETHEMKMIYNLDHEVGHHVVRNGMPFKDITEHKAECAADSFAVLRHIQRFGLDTDLAFHKIGHTASYITLASEMAHYTGNAITQTILKASQTDISGLSLQQTAKLAGDIAAATALGHKRLKKIAQAFSQAANTYHTDQAFSEKVLTTWFEAFNANKDDQDIYNAGRQFYSLPSIQQRIQRFAKTNPYWQNALTILEPKHTAKPPTTTRSHGYL